MDFPVATLPTRALDVKLIPQVGVNMFRVIAHPDRDALHASVEQRDHATLCGQRRRSATWWLQMEIDAEAGAVSIPLEVKRKRTIRRFFSKA